MFRALFALTVFAAAPTALADDVTDVLLLPGDQQLWIALDSAPAGLTYETRAGVITLILEGFEASLARAIVPASGDEVSAVSVEPGSGVTTIQIEGGFGASAAQLREGGVLIDLSGARYRVATSGPAMDETEAPADRIESEQAWTDTPTSEQSDPSEAEPQGHINTRPETYRISDSAPEPVVEDTGPVSTPQTVLSMPSRLTSEAPQSEVVESAQEVDLTSVPGETALAEPETIEPGPCDPTAAAVASSPWDLDALANHAACLVEIGETANGAGLFERVLAFEPGHFQAALGLAQLRERQGRRSDAARLFETAANSALTDGQALAARQSARRLREEN